MSSPSTSLLPWRWLLALLVSCLCLACVRQPVLFPETEGYHHKLPKPGSRVIVWTDAGRVPLIAVTWLHKRGLILIEPAKVLQVLGAERGGLTVHEEARLLQAGRLLNAATLILLDSTVGAGGDRAPVSAGDGKGHSRDKWYGDGSVTVRGVDIESGELIFLGHAAYPERLFVGDEKEMTAKLICQAFATAWGLRDPGDQPIPSESMCEATAP